MFKKKRDKGIVAVSGDMIGEACACLCVLPGFLKVHEQPDHVLESLDPPVLKSKQVRPLD